MTPKQKQEKAFELFQEGHTYRSIMEKCGWKSPRSAYLAVEKIYQSQNVRRLSGQLTASPIKTRGLGITNKKDQA